MNCPLCVDQRLLPHFSGGIEIDVCEKCKGVWLDRGELGQLVATHAANTTGPMAAVPPNPPPTPPQREERQRVSDEKYSKQDRKKKRRKRRKGWADRLEDVLDL